MSSMFPYTFFFIPEAFVEIHPPRDENSTESGSCPQTTFSLRSCYSKAAPIIPA